MGKLGFAGIVIGGILRMDLRQDILFITGIVVVFAFFAIGLILITKEVRPEKTGFRQRKRRSYGKGGRK